MKKYFTRKYWRNRRALRILQHAKLAMWDGPWWEYFEAIHTITRAQWEIHDEQASL
jgi:hypothetical protein